MIFENPKGRKVDIGKIKEDTVNLIDKYPEGSFKVIIGTDSQKKGSQVVFITVIVVYRKGKGGTYYLRQDKVSKPISLKEKIYKEATMSLEVADILRNLTANKEIYGNLEIHVDVGENGETKKLIKEIINFVSERGYKIFVKPNSFAASKVADRHTK